MVRVLIARYLKVDLRAIGRPQQHVAQDAPRGEDSPNLLAYLDGCLAWATDITLIAAT
jgi:hypothetical protein